ncbi:hypothetical protein [Nocardioides campestrisoli]|uniref:hypothetical protein n=1 Tax=Nocardioides campestrisoli TaxID=2736757 RepID=UPI0015E74D5F|nr:hypothetical protein [Nocardioides campestrisoli]
MSTPADGPARWARELLSRRPVQPDARTCGASALVLAEACRSEAYARALVEGRVDLAAETSAMHRRVTGAVDVTGRLQTPWPRALGTPPWAAARQLAGRTGLPYRVRPLWPGVARESARAAALAELRTAVLAGLPCPVYVGSAALPRHVLLVLAAGRGPADPLVAHDPATGRPRRLEVPELVSGRLGTGWPVPWFTVAPAPRPSARRTPA